MTPFVTSFSANFESTFLTFTKHAANRVNMLIVESIFKNAQLPNEKIVSIYFVTINKDDCCETFYPFCPAYATTICKDQGQTFKESYSLV